jgi:hypothetical protein
LVLLLCGCGVDRLLQMLETAHSLKVLVWSAVVDIIAPQAHKQQQQQQPSNRLLQWSSGSSRSTEPSSPRQRQGLAAAAAAAVAGSSGSPGAVDPAMLLKGVDVLLLDLQADLPLMYRCVKCER